MELSWIGVIAGRRLRELCLHSSARSTVLKAGLGRRLKLKMTSTPALHVNDTEHRKSCLPAQGSAETRQNLAINGSFSVPPVYHLRKSHPSAFYLS
jgi:hypothetical protein